MDKKTLLAVVLSVIVMSGGYLIQNKLNPVKPVEKSEIKEKEIIEKEKSSSVSLVQPAVSNIVAVEENITARWVADSNSESWLSKNIRPLVVANFTFLKTLGCIFVV